MKNTFGNNLTITLFGESHGPEIGIVIDGLTPGLSVDTDYISSLLARRRPSSLMDTPRQEKDNFHFASGVFNNKTTGSPLAIIIPNENTQSKDYNYGPARPSHADYSANCKYHGFEDYRGGGHFSGRITAALVAAGGIFLPALESKGIKIGTHILQCKGVHDDSFNTLQTDILTSQINSLQKANFPVLNTNAGTQIEQEILKARENSDSVGGITQTAISGLMAGVGEPWFDSIESLLSHAMFSLGGVKGIEFGKGFDFANENASTCNDAFYMDENKSVHTKTNNNAGINGGISNGMPIVFQCAVKPTPSIAQPQQTIDFNKMENTELTIKGRHDPAIIRRICPVIDSLTSFVICDFLTTRFGTDFLVK